MGDPDHRPQTGHETKQRLLAIVAIAPVAAVVVVALRRIDYP